MTTSDHTAKLEREHSFVATLQIQNGSPHPNLIWIQKVRMPHTHPEGMKRFITYIPACYLCAYIMKGKAGQTSQEDRKRLERARTGGWLQGFYCG